MDFFGILQQKESFSHMSSKILPLESYNENKEIKTNLNWKGIATFFQVTGTPSGLDYKQLNTYENGTYAIILFIESWKINQLIFKRILISH